MMQLLPALLWTLSAAPGTLSVLDVYGLRTVPEAAVRAAVGLRPGDPRSLPALAEMARWRNPGHALPPYMILACVEGMDDGEAFRAWRAGERERVIERAAATPRASSAHTG